MSQSWLQGFKFFLLPWTGCRTHWLLFIHLGGKRNCKRKLPFPRIHSNALVTFNTQFELQLANHYTMTLLCIKQLLLYRILMRYHGICILQSVINWQSATVKKYMASTFKRTWISCWLFFYLQEKKTICDQLIELIKSVQSVSKFFYLSALVSFE